MKARALSPAGPWAKEYDIVPFRPVKGTYYSDTASPGQVVKQGNEYLMFFSGSFPHTIGIARTKNLEGAWTLDPRPLFASTQYVENTALYFEKANRTWFLFTNHVAGVYTDAVWAFWTKDIAHWNAANKAVVLDGRNCTWSKKAIGMPSVIKVGSRLALLYDAPGSESTSHMGRDIGLAWLDLPLVPPRF